MAWVGLERYGYLEDTQRLAYRWLYMYVAFIPRLIPQIADWFGIIG